MNKRGRPKKLSVESNYVEMLSYNDELVEYEMMHGKGGGELDIFEDSIEMEKFIDFLPAEEVMLILFRYMGYCPSEIMEFMGVRSQRTYYEHFNSLKTHYFLFKTLHKD